MLSNIEEKGNLLFGMENSNTFLKSSRVLANTIATMPDIEIISAYKSFLRNLEVYGFQGTEENLITSINNIKTIFVDQMFCSGVEVIIHIICYAAVKTSAENMVES